jgi:hypothetical protein
MSGSKLLDDSLPLNASEKATKAGSDRRDHPLGMTVHSIPAPEHALDTDTKRTGIGRWKMIALFLVCASPVIASYFTYYVIRPEGRRNFGELIEPQRPLPAQSTVNLAGESSNLQSLKGQWLLVSVANAACDEECSRHLYLQRQLREGMGKEKDRLEWVWLVPDDAPVPEKLLPALKGATVLRVSQSGLSEWLKPAEGHRLSEHLYVVDPMGNWMLRFPATLDVASAAKAKKDLDRLLRASAFWDQAGRETAPQSKPVAAQ